MSIFVKATLAPKPRTNEARQISTMYAGVLTLLAVTQLFTFDEFIEFIPSLGLPFGETAQYLIAPLLVVFEIFAIPFLLRMTLSPAFRWVSMVLGWLVAALWLFISTWIVLTHPPVTTVGFLGTLVDLVPGWWAVLMSLAFGAMAAWSSWGLWPGSRSKVSKR